MNFVRQNIIGAITISSLVFFSIFISQFLSSKNILISSAFICIFLGLVLGNIFSFKKIEPFTNFCLKKLLRIGIAFLGLSLSLTELFNYGFTAILLIIINIITKAKPISKDRIPASIESCPKSGPTVLSSTTDNGAGSAPERKSKARSVAV